MACNWLINEEAEIYPTNFKFLNLMVASAVRYHVNQLAIRFYHCGYPINRLCMYIIISSLKCTLYLAWSQVLT